MQIGPRTPAQAFHPNTVNFDEDYVNLEPGEDEADAVEGERSSSAHEGSAHEGSARVTSAGMHLFACIHSCLGLPYCRSSQFQLPRRPRSARAE